MNVVELPLDQIQRLKFQTRHSNGDSAWAEGVGELAEDIGRQGQLQPALVIESGEDFGPPYILLVGHRRAAACESLGRPLQCIIRPAQDFNSYGLLQTVWAENVLRQGWTPVERAEMEVRLYRAAYVSGRISTKTHQVAGVPTYPELRSQQTGETRKTIENYVALGHASPALKHEVDIAAARDSETRRAAALTVSGGYSLARFDAETQASVVQALHEGGVKRAGPREVAVVVNAVRQRAGQPALKNGVQYAPSLETKTLGADLALTKRVNDVLYEALHFYAEHTNWAYTERNNSVSKVGLDWGERARKTIQELAQMMELAGTGEVGKDASE